MRTSLFACLRRDTAGIASIEFAIVAPVLLAGLLAMVDTGTATAVRMEMDRNVRAGAQAAMSLNNDADAIRTIVLASADSPEGLAVDVNMVCTCAGGGSASCTAPCSDGAPPSVFFDISATRAQPGIIVGSMTLRSHTRVQIR
jgi:hypothetical protein